MRTKYDLLFGISTDATEEPASGDKMDILQRNYRTLCKKYHPDINKEDPGAAERFIEIQNAYNTLKSILDDTDTRELNILVKVVVSRSEMYSGCRRQFNITRIHDDKTDIYGAIVVVPCGAYNGQILTLSDGGHIIGSKAGQLHVHLEEYNDTQFARDGSNLTLNLNITLTQALIGDPIPVQHFQKLIYVPVRMPHTNYIHVLPEMGMPILSTGHFGNLYVKYTVIFPSLDPQLVQSLLSAKYPVP